VYSIPYIRRAALVSLVVLVATLSACGDGPTELARPTNASRSTGDATTQDMNLGTYCDPDPTIGCTVVGGSPTSPTPTCTSVTCTSTGGTGGYQGGGGSGGSGGCTTSCDASTVLKQLTNDFVNDTIPPNCAHPAKGSEYIVCTSVTPAPGTTWRQRTEDALHRIEQRGEPCASIARQGWALLNMGRIGYYPRQDGYDGGYGVADWGAYLEEPWVDRFYDHKDSTGRNLDFGLVHEIEHQMHVDHVSTDKFGVDHTLNDTRCAG